MAGDKREKALDAALAREGIGLPARHRPAVLKTFLWLEDGVKALRDAYPEAELPEDGEAEQ